MRAYLRGQFDFERGVKLSENPYKNARSASQWRYGWTVAQKECEQG
jgi:hypothetical protein